jgi:signal transduction histidine kinase
MSEKRDIEYLGIEELGSVAKFRITKSQYFLFAVALLSIILLGISSVTQSISTGEREKLLSDIETPAASIIFTQRETLVYATRLALWSNGGTTRREVQIARNLLAQRLAVVDSSGRTMGSRASSQYFKALYSSDAIVSAAPVGVLPEKLHRATNDELVPVIDEILAQARQLVVSYQRSIDQEMVERTKDDARRNSLNLALFYIILFSSALFLLLNFRSNFKNYRVTRASIEREQRRLQEMITELATAQERVLALQDLDKAKTALISTVNHELRTPLTSIIGYVELMQREQSITPDSEMARYLEVLERNSHILLSLVESMLSLSKFDSATGKLPNKAVNLSQVIDDAIFTLDPVIKSSDITIIFSRIDNVEVRGDTGQLNQVFINIIANAIKFSPASSTISIAMKMKDKSRVEITISDQGVGIPEQDLPHIFTRFFRASNVDSGKFQGTGLGLSIVQQVIDHHNGSIAVTSQEGVGTLFTLNFPLLVKGDIDG